MPHELVVFLVLALLTGVAVWLLHRGAGTVDDEPPTLDTRNHLDDDG